MAAIVVGARARCESCSWCGAATTLDDAIGMLRAADIHARTGEPEGMHWVQVTVSWYTEDSTDPRVPSDEDRIREAMAEAREAMAEATGHPGRIVTR